MPDTASRDGGESPDTQQQGQPRTASKWRAALPVVVSGALMAWIAWRFPFGKLQPAIAYIDWWLMLPLTVTLVMSLFLWDAWCIRWLFSGSGQRVRYPEVVRARGMSYLIGAVNYGLGQGLFAWQMAKVKSISFVTALSLFVLLAIHDMVLLFGMGLFASLGGQPGRFQRTTVICSVGLAVVASMTVALVVMPAGWRNRAKQTRWGAFLNVWDWKRSLGLCLLRIVNFAISMIYLSLALTVCGDTPKLNLVVTAVSLIQLAEGLPITVSGLGSRESILLLVLGPDGYETPLVLGLTWSAGLILGRVAIGLGHIWIFRDYGQPKAAV